MHCFGHVKDVIALVDSAWHGHVNKRTHYATVERVANWSGTFGLSGTNSDTMKMANIFVPHGCGGVAVCCEPALSVATLLN